MAELYPRRQRHLRRHDRRPWRALYRRVFPTDENTSSSGDVVVFDAALSYKIQPNTTFELNVTNLFDEKYVAYGGFGADFYNPGLAVYATLRQTWQAGETPPVTATGGAIHRSA